MTSSLTQQQKTFINFRKAGLASFKDDIELKLKKQQRPTNVYHAKKTLRKPINCAAGRHIPHGRIETVVANFPNEEVKLPEKRSYSKKTSKAPPKKQLNLEIKTGSK